MVTASPRNTIHHEAVSAIPLDETPRKGVDHCSKSVYDECILNLGQKLLCIVYKSCKRYSADFKQTFHSLSR